VWALRYMIWGPQVTIAPQFLPQQINAVSLHADSNVILFLQGADGTQSLNWPTFTVVDIPEPSAPFLALGRHELLRGHAPPETKAAVITKRRLIAHRESVDATRR
jgi:hypothetical protein